MWWLVACGNPISNDALLADGAFLLALPSETRLRSPAIIRTTPEGDSLVLVDAIVAGNALDALTAAARASADALRDATPVERTDVIRRWDAIPAAAEIEGSTVLWYVSAVLVRANLDADIEWTLSIADQSTGPWSDVASGRHDPSGTGTFDWAFDAAEIDAIAVDYGDATSPAGGREVDVLGSSLGIPVTSWGLVDSSTLSWTGLLAVTSDGQRWPGSAAAFANDVGGRAAGELDVGGATATFDACWDPGGDVVFQGGSPEVAASGVPGNCAVAAFVE